MKRISVIIAAILLTSVAAFAQKEFGEAVRFDTIVHDFGKVDTRDGAVSCTFNLTNISGEPLLIQAVTTTCSCTSATWTRSTIAPGGKGEVNVTFTNDEGPYPFDKTLNVYVSLIERPIVIHVKGTAFTGKKKN